MRIGIIAPEFPPMLGGMAELARGLAAALAASDPVRIYSFPARSGPREAAPPGPHVDRLTGRPWKDGPLLAADEDKVDVWLALNAGLVPLAARLRRPFVAYFHGNDFVNPFLPCGPRAVETFRRPYLAETRHALRRRSIRRRLPEVRHVLTNSRQTAALIEDRLGLGADRVTVAYPGVGEAFFQDPDPRVESPETLRLLTVTRISRHTRRKNVDGVLRALALVGDRLPWTYTVVGGGDDLLRHETLARELGIDDRVTFTGSVDFEQLLAAYRRADLFVLASRATRKDVEGFGIVYIEAAASGVPSICSREGGATDAVRDGLNGILIDRSTPEHIAAGIERFAAERNQLRPEAARKVAEEFRWPRVAVKVREALARQVSSG